MTVKEEHKAAETVEELIAALQAKVNLEGLALDTKLQYIIMGEDGSLITMKMMDYMAGRVIKVLKTMTKGKN